MSPVEYFFKGTYNTIKSILSVHEQLLFIFLTCLVQDKINVKILLASLKTLTNFKHCYSESRIKFVFRLSFALIGRFFPVFIHSRLSEPFSGSQAGFGKTFRETGGYQKAENMISEESYWKEFLCL
jgi:hypothetical protein